MKVYIGVIDYGEGTVAYAAATMNALTAKVADYCRDYWAEDGPRDENGDPRQIPSADVQVIAEYFSHEDCDEIYSVKTDHIHSPRDS